MRVFFGCLLDAQAQGVGFGEAFEWDIPLLEGYRWEVLDDCRAGKAKRMKDMAGNPSRLKEMGRRAQRRVLEQYSVEQAVRGVLDAVGFLKP